MADSMTNEPKWSGNDILPTTDDNPFDPFTQWDRWSSYDHRAGHNTWENMATLMCPSSELTDAEWDDMYMSALASLLMYRDPYNIRNLAVRGKTNRFGVKLSNNKKE